MSQSLRVAGQSGSSTLTASPTSVEGLLVALPVIPMPCMFLWEVDAYKNAMLQSRLTMVSGRHLPISTSCRVFEMAPQNSKEGTIYKLECLYRLQVCERNAFCASCSSF